MTADPDLPPVLVVGAGSAGARHSRLLAAAGAIVHVTDPDEQRVRHVVGATGATPVGLGEIGSDRYAGTVLASPTSLHADQVGAALSGAGKILVEKPIATSASDATDLAETAGHRVAVAYNLRYHQPLAAVAEIVHGGQLGSITTGRVWFGQWLPDWRPTTDYRVSYSARRELGGGILLDASHELDVVRWMFGSGRYEVLGSAVARLGPLEIDVEDTVEALIRTPENAVITVSLDCLSRRYRRGVEIIGTEQSVRLDWTRRVIEIDRPGGVTTVDADESVEHAYEKQALAFLAWVSGGPEMAVMAGDGAEVVVLADAIRDAAHR
jgi:predicted dehydrogenase